MRWNGMHLTGTIPTQLGAMTALSTLVLSYNDLSGSLPNSLATLTGLSKLQLAGNRFAGTFPPLAQGLVLAEW